MVMCYNCCQFGIGDFVQWCEWEGFFGIYQFFFFVDGRQIEGGFVCGVQVENMGDYFCCLDFFCLYQCYCGVYIVSIIVGGVDVVGKGVVYVVEVDWGVELFILGVSKEIQVVVWSQ